MTDQVNEVSKLGDCIGNWSVLAAECETCLFVLNCRKITEGSEEKLDIYKTPIEIMIDSMREGFYFIEMRQKSDMTLMKFARNGVAVYVLFGDDNTVSGKVWGNKVELGPDDISRFGDYAKLLAEKVDAGDGQPTA